MSENGVSIIVCCYNSASQIEKVLDHLAAQITDNINCEIILVDNVSTDNISEVARSVWDKIGSDKISFNLVSEPLPGLSNARLKGIGVASYEFLIFCDDDNWLDENYVQNIHKLFHANPDVGIIGGFGTAGFENELLKPFWFDTFHHGYAVSLHGGEQENRNTVFGAGMAIRNSILKILISEHAIFLDDRKKDELSSGGDSEICMRVRLAGYRVLYTPQLTFVHFLPANRLTWDYLKKLHIGFAKSHVVLNLYDRALSAENSKLPALYWLKKALYYSGIYIKYWPKHYSAYRNGHGTIEEILHITWKHIALNYFEHNFKTVGIYRKICVFKNKEQAA